MTIRNTSLYRTEHVRELVLFAARAMLVATWDLEVRVTKAGVAYVGQFDAGRVLIGIGEPEMFPLWSRYGGTSVGCKCWQEAIVSTAAHEFAHARQEREGRRFVETEAERAALGALAAFDPEADSARWMVAFGGRRAA